jgi:uncharacterized protein YjbJ (UPF0337 family)
MGFSSIINPLYLAPAKPGSAPGHHDLTRFVYFWASPKGAVKETVGKVTGDAKTQAEGAAEKTAGKVQNAIGGAKDAVREALKK